MRYTLPRIKLTPSPVHVVQYENSPYWYGCTFTTRATTTKGIALAAARAAAEDFTYWHPLRVNAAPVVTHIDDVFLAARDWKDPEMDYLIKTVDREASKRRPAIRHHEARPDKVHS